MSAQAVDDFDADFWHEEDAVRLRQGNVQAPQYVPLSPSDAWRRTL